MAGCYLCEQNDGRMLPLNRLIHQLLPLKTPPPPNEARKSKFVCKINIFVTARKREIAKSHECRNVKSRKATNVETWKGLLERFGIQNDGTMLPFFDGRMLPFNVNFTFVEPPFFQGSDCFYFVEISTQRCLKMPEFFHLAPATRVYSFNFYRVRWLMRVIITM